MALALIAEIGPNMCRFALRHSRCLRLRNSRRGADSHRLSKATPIIAVTDALPCRRTSRSLIVTQERFHEMQTLLAAETGPD